MVQISKTNQKKYGNDTCSFLTLQLFRFDPRGFGLTTDLLCKQGGASGEDGKMKKQVQKRNGVKVKKELQKAEMPEYMKEVDEVEKSEGVRTEGVKMVDVLKEQVKEMGEVKMLDGAEKMEGVKMHEVEKEQEQERKGVQMRGLQQVEKQE